MSLTTNRIALSTIKDSHLNSSPSNTPSKDKKRPTLYNTNKPKSKLFSPSHMRIRQPDLITKSFSIAHSATSLNKKFSPLRAVSFSDYRSTLSNKPSSSSTSSSSPSNLKLQSTDDAFKNDTIGLAATKLKLKLQLALYKVQQNKQTRLKATKYYNNNQNYINSYNHKIHKSNGHKSMAIKLNSILGSLESPPTSNRTSPVSAYESPNTTNNNNNNYMFKSSTASLPTPPEQITAATTTTTTTANYYSHSINVNLNATPRFNKTKMLKNKKVGETINSATSTLNKVANSRTKNNKINKSSKLKLFQIKKNSIYYCSNQKKLPLIQNDIIHCNNQLKHSNHLDITAAGSQSFNNNMSAPSSQGISGGNNMSFFTYYPHSQEQESSQNSTTTTTNIGATRLPSITVDRTISNNTHIILVLALPITHYHQLIRF